MGQTFLHLLCEKPPLWCTDIRAFTKLLRELRTRDFSFSTVDYYGRTFLHTFFSITNASHALTYTIAFISEILSIASVDLSVPDNSGFSIFEHLLSDVWRRQPESPWQGLIRKHCKDSFSVSYFRPLSSCDTSSSIISWIELRIQSGDVTSLDEMGDTMLAHILKHGPSTDGGRFLTNCTRNLTAAGARIHMRDRNGDTARRGLRPVVTLLLRRRAQVHSRNYKGVGILVQAEKVSQEFWKRNSLFRNFELYCDAD